MANKKKLNIELRWVLRFFWLIIGAAIAATGLEIFLVPNHIIDGGIVGISTIANYITKVPLGIFLVALNLPFLFLGISILAKPLSFVHL